MDSGLILAGIGALLLCIIITIFLLLVYSGLFQSVVVGAGRPPIKDVVLAYKFVRGPYKEAGPYFTETASLAPDNKALAIYYDDPNTVEASKLRYIVAVILAEGGEAVNEEMKASFLKENYKIHNLPYVTNVVKTEFPYISLMSIFIAISKVYPKLAYYIQENKLCAHPCIEIYDGKTIHFMSPLAKQDEFYVPEYNQSESDTEGGDIQQPLSDDSISYNRPESKEFIRSISTNSDKNTAGDVVKMVAVATGAGEAINLTAAGEGTADDKADNVSESSSGSPFEDIKPDELASEICGDDDTTAKE